MNALNDLTSIEPFALLLLAKTAKSLGARANAVEAVARIKDQESAVRELLLFSYETIPTIQEAAICGMRRHLGRPEILARLRELAVAVDPTIRAIAIEALAEASQMTNKSERYALTLEELLAFSDEQKLEPGTVPK